MSTELTKIKGSKNTFAAKRPQTIGEYAKTLILRGMDNEQVVRAVLKRFPDAGTTKGCISWYRSKLSGVEKRVMKRNRKGAA